MNSFKYGSVKISNDIIDQLIAETVLRVDGVNEVLGYKDQVIDLKKKDSIVSVINGDTMTTAVTVNIDEDRNIQKVCENAQKEVIKQIRTMLGLKVTKVNIIVNDLVSPAQ